METAPDDGLQDHYLVTLNLATSENLKFYNKSIIGLPENDRYDLSIFPKNCRILYLNLVSKQ